MAATAVDLSPGRIRRLVIEAAIVFVAYYIAGKLGQATSEIRSSNLGPVWPAYGVALAAVLLCGYRIWPALLISAFLVAFQSPVSPITAAGQAIAATLGALTGGALLHRVAFDTAMSRLRDALNLIFLGAVASALVSSILGMAVLYASGVQPYSNLGYAWLIYWLGDGTGVLLITPLVLTATNFLTLRPPARLAEFAALVLCLVLTCVVIFADLPMPSMSMTLNCLAYVVFPFVAWAAIRFGVHGVALSTLLVAVIATVATALGLGPFVQTSIAFSAILLDVFFTVLATSGLMLAAVIVERESAESERTQLIRDQAAVEARLRLAAIVESSDDAIIRLDTEGVITDWNGGAERLYGYSAQEANGKGLLDLVHLSDTDRVSLNAFDLVYRRETTHQRKDGTLVEVSLSISPILNDEGKVIGTSAIASNITERQQAAAALRESEYKLRLILDSAAEGIYGIDPEGNCTFCNQACVRLLGYDSADALLGRQMHQLIHRRADGTVLPPEECRILGVLLTGKGIHADDELLYRADGSSFPAEWWSYPQWRDATLVGAVVGFSDVTLRKQAEDKAAALHDELTHFNRVGMLSALTGALAHEINQPLAAIHLNVESASLLLNSPSPSLGELRETLDDIRNDNQRAGAILRHLRALLKKDTARHEPLDTNSIVGDVVKLIQGEATRRGISIHIHKGPPTHPVFGDRVQMQQVVLNLLMNACDAVQGCEKPFRRIELNTVSRHETVAIQIRDQGIGMSDDQMTRLFQPFYTTKPDGMGLGLSICRAILSAHGGTLDAERNPDRGMTFSAVFPNWQWQTISESNRIAG